MTDTPNKSLRFVFILIAVAFAVYLSTTDTDALFSKFKLDIEDSGIEEELKNIQTSLGGFSNIEGALSESMLQPGDFDEDGLDNRVEMLIGSNLALTDSDGDGVTDNEEFLAYTDISSLNNETSLSPQFIEQRVIELSSEGIVQAQDWASLSYLHRLRAEDLSLSGHNGNLYLDLAYQYNPSEDLYLQELSFAHQEERRDLALLVAQRFVATYPENADTYFHRGYAFQQLNQVENAEEDYLQALEKGSDLPALYNNLGILAQDRGETELAKSYYDQAIERAPENKVYQQNRALLDKNS